MTQNPLKLDKSNYFSQEANRHYMSVSQYKDFLKCEAAAMAKLTGEFIELPSDALIAGSYLHAWNEGKLEEFKANNPDLYSTRGASKGQLKAQYQVLNDCINTLQNDRLCMMALEGQKEVIFTAELFGVPWKIMIDVYNPSKGRFADLKTVKSLHDKYWNPEHGKYQSFVEFYGYTTQMAVYAEVERIATGRDTRLEPFIVAVTKETPPDKAVINGFDEIIDYELSQIKSNLDHIMKVKNGLVDPENCDKCEYCRSKKQLYTVIHYTELLS